jgi:hypothetical protein
MGIEQPIISAGPFSVGWHTIKASRDSSGTWELCVDGVVVGTVVENTYSDLSRIFIGRYGGFDNIIVSGPMEAPTTVSIDIMPSNDLNCFNSDGHGVIPVGILSSTDFDANLVDPTTVSLDGQEVRLVGKGNLQAHSEDVNGDGLDDLIVQIEDLDGTYQEGDTMATLTAVTYDGIPIQGMDSICIVR